METRGHILCDIITTTTTTTTTTTSTTTTTTLTAVDIWENSCLYLGHKICHTMTCW